MKILKDIVKGITCTITGDEEMEVNKLVFDSRKVGKNDVFVAVKGTQVDGHKFIPDVIAKGTGVIVCEDIPEETAGVCFVKVGDSAKALGVLSGNYFDNPSEKLKLVGVTGTNGKTSIATFLHELFIGAGYKVGLLSTIVNKIGSTEVEATHTTPDAIQINQLLGDMVDAGCEYAFMEVSSHAIDQERVSGLKFTGGIFTNITHDHLDYHKTFDNYIKAKKKFFDDISADAFALVNVDDKNAGVMVQSSPARKTTYGLKNMADYKGVVIETHLDGMQLRINQDDVWVRLTGHFNASNLLAVFGAAIELGLPVEEACTGISGLKPVRGRLETMHFENDITAIVDYAHTPDALKNVLEAINKVHEGKGNVITVIGAGGNRDKDKRPKMAARALAGSDKVILTSDNPRFEEPEAIIKDMAAGVEASDAARVLKITDREEAIRTACMLAQPGDIVLVAGKGHEDYQDVKGVKRHFDDKEVILKQFELKK